MELLKIAPFPSSAYAGPRRTSSSAYAPGRAAPVLRLRPAADACLPRLRRLAASSDRTRLMACEYAAAARLPASAAYGGALRAFPGVPKRGVASLCRPVLAAAHTRFLARLPVLLGPMASEHSSAADALGGLRLPLAQGRRVLMRCTQAAEDDVGAGVTEQRIPASAAYGGGLRAFPGFSERGLASLFRPVVAAAPTRSLVRVLVLLRAMASDSEHPLAADARCRPRLPRVQGRRVLIRCTPAAEDDVGVSVTEQQAPPARLKKLLDSLNWKIRLAAALGCVVLAGRIVMVIFENFELTVPNKLAKVAAMGLLVFKTLHTAIKDTKKFSELVLYFIDLYMEDVNVKKKGT